MRYLLVARAYYRSRGRYRRTAADRRAYADERGDLRTGFSSACRVRTPLSARVAIVETIIGSDCAPGLGDRREIKPKAEQDHRVLKYLLRRKRDPGLKRALVLDKKSYNHTDDYRDTGPPTTSNARPKNHDGTAIIKQSAKPFQLFFYKFHNYPPLSFIFYVRLLL